MGAWQRNNAPSWQPSRSLPAVMSSASLHSVKKQPVVFQAGGRRMYGGAEASVCSGYSQVNTFALLLKVRHKQMEACTPRGFKMTIWPSLSHLFTHCVKPNPVYSSLLLSGLTIELKLRETLLCMWDVCVLIYNISIALLITSLSTYYCTLGSFYEGDPCVPIGLNGAWVVLHLKYPYIKFPLILCSTQIWPLLSAH